MHQEIAKQEKIFRSEREPAPVRSEIARSGIYPLHWPSE